MVFKQSWWGIVTNLCKLRCEYLVAKGNVLGWVLDTQFGWISFLCLGSKIGEKVKSWFLSNLGGELSKMYEK